MKWYIKRKPLGISFFRDNFSYLECVMPNGTLWVETRSEAIGYNSLEAARKWLKTVRVLDPDAIVVRVK